MRSGVSGIATTPIEPGRQPVPARRTATSPPPAGTSTMLVRSACIARWQSSAASSSSAWPARPSVIRSPSSATAACWARRRSRSALAPSRGVVSWSTTTAPATLPSASSSGEVWTAKRAPSREATCTPCHERPASADAQPSRTGPAVAGKASVARRPISASASWPRVAASAPANTTIRRSASTTNTPASGSARVRARATVCASWRRAGHGDACARPWAPRLDTSADTRRSSALWRSSLKTVRLSPCGRWPTRSSPTAPSTGRCWRASCSSSATRWVSAEAIEHLVGLQAQAPNAPYVGLWTRLARFDPAALATLLEGRAAIRTHVMRTTVHLVTARDGALLRPLMQPVLDRSFASSPWAKKLPGVDLDAVAAAGRELLGRRPADPRAAGRAPGRALPGPGPGVARAHRDDQGARGAGPAARHLGRERARGVGADRGVDGRCRWSPSPPPTPWCCATSPPSGLRASPTCGPGRA